MSTHDNSIGEFLYTLGIVIAGYSFLYVLILVIENAGSAIKRFSAWLELRSSHVCNEGCPTPFKKVEMPKAFIVRERDKPLRRSTYE